MNSMIRLKDIERKDNIITADAYPEDSTIPTKFIYHVDTGNIEPFTLPEGYEYCKGNMAMARWHIKKILEQNEELPKERLIMWY